MNELITPSRAVHFSAWLSNMYEIKATVADDDTAALVIYYANGEIGDEIDLPEPLDARKIAAALIAMADEWDKK